jgi:hypothetical protein
MPDHANSQAVTPQRNAASEDHDASLVGCTNSKELLARLRTLRR